MAKLREELDKLYNGGVHDPEVAHAQADTLLLDYINDKEVTELYDQIQKWYA